MAQVEADWEVLCHQDTRILLPSDFRARHHRAPTDMKDVFSAFNSEFFRPLVTLLLPGAISVSTWIISGMLASTTIHDLVSANRVEAAVITILLMFFLGLVCEDIGSHLEELFDRKRDRWDKTHKANWKSYLRVAYRLEPIGHRYLRTVLLRLKFELGSLVLLC